MKLLFDDPESRYSTIFITMEVFHDQCFSHVLNLAVYECLNLIEGPVKKLKAALNAIRSFVKLCDVFEYFVETKCQRKTMPHLVTVPTINSKTHRSSIFNIVKDY